MNETQSKKENTLGCVDASQKTSSAREPWLEKETIWREAQTLIPSEARRTHSLNIIKAAAVQKKLRHTPSFGELLCTQLQYISPLFWVIQGSFVVLLIIILNRIDLTQRGLTDYLCWISVLAAWMGATACSSLNRHFSRGMAELEQSCYLDFTQMWTIKMTLSGCIDILMLTLCCGKIANDTELPFGQICVYILVPFVLSNLYCLFMFTALRFGRLRYGLPALAFSAGTGAAILAKLPPLLYTLSFLWVWVMILVAGTMVLFWQLKRIHGKIRRGEILCWN